MAWWKNSEVVLKSKYRFVLVMGNYMMPTVKTVTKPSVNIEKKEFRLTNHYYKYPGLVQWAPIEITFVDAAGNLESDDAKNIDTYIKRTTRDGLVENTENIYNGKPAYSPFVDNADATYNKGRWNMSEFLNRMLRYGGYKNPDGTSSNNALEKAAVMDASFGEALLTPGEMRILQIDPKGHIVEEWKIINPIFTKLSWGSLDYSSDEPVECSLTVEYDWAEFSVPTGVSKPPGIITTN